MSTVSGLEQSVQDIRFGLRSLSKSPGTTGIAILSLALGIGASTAIYSVVHAVVLNPFPYKDVDTLMSVKVWEPGRRGFRTGYTTEQFLEIAERNSIFEAVIASTISDVLWSGQGEPQRLRGNYVTRDTFSVMGVPALLGRVLITSDFASDSPPVCVLGYRFWQRQFGGSPGALGRELRLNGHMRTVVGVMPRPFMWRGADVYIPIDLRRGQEIEGVRYVHLLGRMKSGVNEAQAEADLRPIIGELKKREPAQFPDKWRVGLLSFKETFPSAIRGALWILFGAVGLLLLIACANVSNLLLAKAGGRQKEMGVRAALGASRLRLIRQLLTESLLLALGGGLLGVAFAYAGLRAILAIVPPDTIPDEAVIAINTPVLLFTLGICALTALIFGLAPAFQASAAEPASPLRGAGRGITGGLRQRWLRGSLVVAEVALSLMLLAGASLMIRTVLA
ncbi:MAG TPA: ABC transporter permease, partial [Acidobacteriota bacterium]|nr:ABC transporter permease [Acidobacteriota bacterium]